MGEGRIKKWLDEIRRGDRLALSQAITLVESRNEDDRRLALQLMKLCMTTTGGSKRIAISGPPGVGKSTLIERLGQYHINSGGKVAVLAIDPSSQIHRGSILGDKTRMETLAKSPQAFIRPSPSAGYYGGLGLATMEVIHLFEAAAYELILVETVGVGQSETDARYVCDLMVQVLQPAAGDDLQMIKMGLRESADLRIINKYDGSLKASAGLLYQQIKAGGVDGDANVPLLLCSALSGHGVEEFWNKVHEVYEKIDISSRRTEGLYSWYKKKIQLSLERLITDRFATEIETLWNAVQSGTTHYLEAVEAMEKSVTDQLS